MKLLHEFTANSWGNSHHRIVVIEDDGTRVESQGAMYEHAAFLHYKDNTYIAFSDYYNRSLENQHGKYISEIILKCKRLGCDVIDRTGEAVEEMDEVEEKMKDEPE